ncbi:hypothetical protein R3P38DRAFT_2414299, partial [Favolaschia claudopus]
SRVKKLSRVAFRTPYPLSRLQRANVTESMKILEANVKRRAELGFTLDIYGMDLSEFVF